LTWVLGFGFLFLLYCLFSLPLSLSLWERVPLANIIQFPWRMVGPASLLLSLLAASAAPLLERLVARASHFWPFVRRPLSLSVAYGLLPAAFWLFSLTWTFTAPFNTPTSFNVRDLAAYEATGQLGTTSAGEFLPEAVRELPAPDSLAAQYASQPIIERLAALPEAASLVSQSATLTSATATIDATSSTTLTFNVFYFPGWRATVDGEPAAITPSEPHGLITVPVSSGRHTVVINFGLTPLRVTAVTLSLVALLILAWMTYRLAIPNSQFTMPNSQFATRNSSFTLPFVHLSREAVILSLLFLRALLIDGHATPFSRTRFDGASVVGVGQSLDANFDNQLVLIGLDLPRTVLAADDELSLVLYWRAQEPPNADYSTSVQVLDDQGTPSVFGQSDSQHPGHVPTSRWRLDQYARDEHRLRLLPGTPPGTYRLVVSVYRAGGAALSVLNQDQIPQGQWYSLDTLTVTRASRPPVRLDAAQPLNLVLGSLSLIGQTLNTTSPLAGDDLQMLLYWRADSDARPAFRLRTELVAGDTIVGSMEGDVARADYPTSLWSRGEVVRAPLRFRIPASAPPGPAQLRVSLVSPEEALVAGPYVIATLDVRVPERSFSIPVVSHAREDVLGGMVKLVGYDLTADVIVLYWQALAPMEVGYTAFVHVLDAGGRILAQVDAVPLNGLRPTTGWLPGEVLTDSYALSLAGASQIEIGLYDTRTAERLGTVVLTP
jgi:hypothetical protein